MLQQKPFILIVEDDERLRKVLAYHLHALGYMVLQAANFREAVDQIAIKPNLVILDASLPDATGWDVAEWIRSFTQDVPILMTSASIRPSSKQMKKAGLTAFLAKPFSIRELVVLVMQYAPLPWDHLDEGNVG